MKEKNTRSRKEAISQLAFFALCAVLIYTVFWGVGNPVSIGPFSLWLVVLASFFVMALFPAIFNLKEIFRSPSLWLLLLLGVWVLAAAVRGFLKGNELSIIIRDISGLLYFALFPFLFSILNSEKRIRTVMRCMMYAAFALAVMMYVLWIIYLFLPAAFEVVSAFFQKIAFLNYTRVSGTIPRILFVSIPFQLCGCAFPIYFQVKEKKFRLSYAVITGTCLSTLLMTFTRALYLSAAAAAAVIVLFYLLCATAEEKKRMWKQIGAAIGAFLVVIVVISLVGRTNYLKYAVLRVTTSLGQEGEISGETEPATEPSTENVTQPTVVPPTEPATEPTQVMDDEAQHYLDATAYSDSVRYWIKHELMQSIRLSPIAGNGMGLKWVLKKDWPEYSYLDLWAKTGIIGVLLYFMPIIYMAGCILMDFRRKKIPLLSCTWLAVMLGLMCYSVFQPYLNNVQCVIVYCCTLCVGSVEHRKIGETE